MSDLLLNYFSYLQIQTAGSREWRTYHLSIVLISISLARVQHSLKISAEDFDRIQLYSNTAVFSFSKCLFQLWVKPSNYPYWPLIISCCNSKQKIIRFLNTLDLQIYIRALNFKQTDVASFCIGSIQLQYSVWSQNYRCQVPWTHYKPESSLTRTVWAFFRQYLS